MHQVGTTEMLMVSREVKGNGNVKEYRIESEKQDQLYQSR